MPRRCVICWPHRWRHPWRLDSVFSIQKRIQASIMKKRRKTERLTESPVTLRLPTDLLKRIDALIPVVAADSDVATMLGGVSRSALFRYGLLEGVKTLEKRYRSGGK